MHVKGAVATLFAQKIWNYSLTASVANFICFRSRKKNLD